MGLFDWPLAFLLFDGSANVAVLRLQAAASDKRFQRRSDRPEKSEKKPDS